MERKLPIGIQGFEKLRAENFLYVDKTDYIYQLVHNNVPYFLSRPRRFGKSLLLSTLKAYWEGKKELFNGLKIEKLEADNESAWRTYPVFFFDFNGEDYSNVMVEEVIAQHLSEWEAIYGNQYQSQTLGYRFQKLLEMAYQKTGLRCVVLVDEYDKPLLDLVDDEGKRNQAKKVFKGFFSRLKKADEYIQFIFITGVTKFHKVSIFSDLNQLRDISVNEDFSGLCGITEEEIRKEFLPEIELLSKRQGITEDICFLKLQTEYDGYHFHPESCGIYNPYSLFNAFADKEFGSYWFETGTRSFLAKKLKETSFDIRKFTDNSIYASEGMLKDYTGESLDPVPLLYQAGYLTIAGYDSSARIFTLSFPNREVKYGFLESLIPEYIADYTSGSGKDIFTLRRYIEQGELDGIRKVLTALFASISYTVQADPFEHYFQAVIYLVFTLLNKFVLCEMHTCSGRIDCKVETKNYIYLFEFKRDDTAEAALAQIESKDYALPFAADYRKLYKIGAAFDTGSRKLIGWKVREDDTH